MATVSKPVLKQPRVDWKKPEIPTEPCVCGKPLIPIADRASDEGWDLYFACGDADGCEYCYSPIEDAYYIDWPFGEDDKAGYADFMALGFFIVE